MCSCLCSAQVRCDVVSFATISVRYVQLHVVEQKLVHACRLAMSVVSMCPHSGTICPSGRGSPVRHHVLCDVTRHFNRPFGNVLGVEHRRVIHAHTHTQKKKKKKKKNFRSSSITGDLIITQHVVRSLGLSTLHIPSPCSGRMSFTQGVI